MSTTQLPDRISSSPQTEPPPEGVVQSESLLRGRESLQILHNGETYSLRKTRLGKLILTK
jgi:hemin uptake protein HemP